MVLIGFRINKIQDKSKYEYRLSLTEIKQKREIPHPEFSGFGMTTFVFGDGGKERAAVPPLSPFPKRSR